MASWWWCHKLALLPTFDCLDWYLIGVCDSAVLGGRGVKGVAVSRPCLYKLPAGRVSGAFSHYNRDGAIYRQLEGHNTPVPAMTCPNWPDAFKPVLLAN